GVFVDSQSGFQSIFGWYSSDVDLERQSLLQKRTGSEEPAKVDAGFGFLVLLYLFALLFNLLILVAAVALDFVGKFIPPKFQPYLRWRWPAAAAVTLGAFAVLLLHDAVGFGLE